MSAIQRRPHARRTPTIRIHKQPLHIIHELSADEDQDVPRFCIADPSEPSSSRAPSPAKFAMMTSTAGNSKSDRRQASIVPLGPSHEETSSPDSFRVMFSDLPFEFPRPPLPTPSSAKYSGRSMFPSSPLPSAGSFYSSSSSDESEEELVSDKTPIEPLRIVKRRRSLSLAARSALPTSPSSIVVVSPEHSEDEEFDDIEFYADQFNKIVTLSSPLPPSFPGQTPSSQNPSKPRPETLYVPSTSTSPMPSPQLDPGFSNTSVKRSSLAPIRHSRPPPPPPVLVLSRCAGTRPPPRSSVPADIDMEMDEMWEEESMEFIEFIEEDEAMRAESPYPALCIPVGDARLVEPISAHSLQAEFFEGPFTGPSMTVEDTSNQVHDRGSSEETHVGSFSEETHVGECGVETNVVEDAERDRFLRSRWSSSTLSSLHTTQQQKHHSGLSLLSPLKSYFSPRKGDSSTTRSSFAKREGSPVKRLAFTRSQSPEKTPEKRSMGSLEAMRHIPPALVLTTPTRPPRPHAHRTQLSPASPWSFPSTPGPSSPSSSSSGSSSPSPTRQQGRRRPRTSESGCSSCGSEASYTSTRSGVSGRSGKSEWSAASERSMGSAESVMSGGSVMSSGLTRKPIPIEMFLRA